MNLILLGPPGSGKGTQAKLLARREGKEVILVGDILRKEVKKRSSIGQHIKPILAAGQLLPDEMVIHLIEQEMAKRPKKDVFVFDGFPRTHGQAKALDAYFVKHNAPLPQAIFFHLDAPALIERLTTRLSCDNCDSVYNEKGHPPKAAGLCDTCGGELARRFDDDPSTVAKRIDVYHERTEPLIQFYQQSGRLISIEADQPVETIYETICKESRLYDYH